MTFSLALLLLAILILILISAFFSGSETALTATSRARMLAREKNGDKRAGLVNHLTDKRDQLIGAILLGNNLVNILASALATSVFIEIFGAPGVFYATIIMTIIVVIFAEVLPKSWAISDPDWFALRVSTQIRWIVLLFGPITNIVSFIVRKILSAFGVNLNKNTSLLSAHEELRGTVAILHQEGAVVKDDRDRLGGLLDLRELEVSDVMIHRTNMQSLDIDTPAKKIVAKVINSPFTRLPVWKGEPDNIVGFIHAKDVLRTMASKNNKISDLDISKIISKPWFVPETTSLQDQLDAFLRQKTHIALVVDEYGEVEGLVTLEDILEEIVGEIADEHDQEIAGFDPQSDGSVIVEGTLPIRDLNRALDWELPDEEATTVAGLVIHEAQMIPEEKQTFTFYGKRFVVLKRDRNRIAQLRIRTVMKG